MLLFARARANAQFSTPYDPDFAPQSQQQEEQQQEQPAEEEQPLPPILLEGHRFLLLDRADPDHIFAVEESTVVPEPMPFLQFEEQKLKGLRFTQQEYDEARRKLELGILEEEEGAPQEGLGAGVGVAVSTEMAPKPPPPEVELPTYGTSLSVAGRKVIGFNFSEKRYLSDQSATGRPQTTNLIDIEQQLQLRMQGKVGPKITVNVDYDDTKENHQDISVVYSGDPNEVVQNVSFGDIDLSLPATEFVSYNKQLFGIRADIKYKGLNATFIGSRTKGTTKSKQFFGNTQFVTVDIPDTGYTRRTYYDLTFGDAARLPIRAGSERVWVARQIPGQTNVTDVTLTANDLQVQNSSFTGTFSPLNAGVDYTIDYNKGILTFRNSLLQQYLVAVDFIDNTGQSISVETSSTTTTACSNGAALPQGGTCFNAPRLIKTSGDVFISTSAEVGWTRELKTYYNIGQTQIVRDNGRGNFILRVLDQNRVEVGSTLNPVQHYPETINVDFENGVFNLQQPFSVGSASPTIPDPDIYSPTPISKRIIHLEYSYRFKTFFLEPNLVPQSEIVILDGTRLNRNVDYFIDYDAGFITFFNEDRIHSQSEIDISYEVAPFAGITDQSLLGTRVSYDFTKNVSAGSTLLYQTGSKSQTTPSITELDKSLLVYDFDTRVHDVKLGSKFKVNNLAAELAQSRQNLNLNAFAIIDNMEGIKQETAASMLSQQWFISSNPGARPTDVGSNSSKFSWLSEDVPILSINPRAQATSQETQKVLDVSYNFSGEPIGAEKSIVFPFSISGNDFSRSTVLEVVMQGDASNNGINFRLGGVDENADGTGGVTLTCADGRTLTGAPKTEDVNCDGILQPSEDVGWSYAPGTCDSDNHACPSLAVGSGNGRIDSEDLNANGRLDADDGQGNNFGYVGDITGQNPSSTVLPDITDGSNHTTLDFGSGSGWQTFQIPLNVSTATLTQWQTIKQIRISVKNLAGDSTTHTLRFARIAVVGNTWLPGTALDPANNSGPVAGESMVVTPVNSVDNPSYVPIFNAGGDAGQVFSDLYGNLDNLKKQNNSSNISEQALQLNFSSMTINSVTGSSATVTTKRLFTNAIDISQHRFFNFLLYGNAQAPFGTTCSPGDVSSSVDCADHTFFLRVGNDQNFWEIDVPINFVGWKKIRVYQQDTGHNAVANAWSLVQGDSYPPGTVIRSSGTPSLQQVAEIVAGVRRTGSSESGQSNTPGVTSPTPAATNTSGIVYLNEIHVAQPLPRVGTAEKLAADFEMPGWATFGMKYRSIDRNFQTPTSVVSNQDNEQDNAYLNLTRLPYFPMTFNLSRVVTDTPNTAQTGSLSNVVNLLQTGKVTTWTGSAQANFSLGAYPRTSLSYARNRIEYDLLTRLDDRQTYNLTMQYGVPINSRLLPKTIDANAGYGDYNVSFQSPESRAIQGNFNTHEVTRSGGLRLTFVPWTGSSFNPTYSLTKVHESRQDFTSGSEVDSSYPKSATQNIGFSSNFRITSWLNPQASYSLDTLENNILNVSTFVVQTSTYVFQPGDIKTVNRSANGSVSLPLTIGEIFPRSKLFRSLTFINGYQLQDGDVYNNVEKSLNSLDSLWIRSGLHPQNPAAQQASLTLRDTYNSTQRWSPLEAYDIRGRLASFKTLSISNNFVESIQRQTITGTPSKTISTTIPDMVASIGQLEKLWFTERWMSNTQMNFKYAAHRTTNVGQTITSDQSFGTDLRSIVKKRFDTVLSFNNRSSKSENLVVEENTQTTGHQDATAQVTFDVGKFRYTPKTDYTHDVTQLGTGVKTQDLTVITPSMLVRADLSLPRGLVIPGTTKTLLFTNRVIWTTTMSLAVRSSPVTQEDNSKLASMTTSADYELAKNLRMTINGALSRLWHKYLPQENFLSYQLGTTLTFQF